MRRGEVVWHLDCDPLFGGTKDLELAKADVKGRRSEGDIAVGIGLANDNDIDRTREGGWVDARVWGVSVRG